MAKDSSLSHIFFTMLRLGAFTFGGGYAMVPLFEDAFVRKYGWISQDDMMNMVALSQSVPGAIAINCGILIILLSVYYTIIWHKLYVNLNFLSRIFCSLVRQRLPRLFFCLFRADPLVDHPD